MAISNVPTFTDGEIPSAAKLNQLGTAVTTKFSGGVTGADLVWPLVAQGNIDMNSAYTFTNLRTLWSVVNVNEYDTFADAVAALPSAGGCLFVPPGTTVTLDGETVAKAFCVLGAGKTSVLKITTAASSGYMLRTSTDLEGVDIVNCTIDGNTATGSGQDGIQIRKCSQVNLVNVWFKNWSGTPLVIGNDGTGGNNSAEVRVIGCHFEGGSGRHILIEDVDGLTIAGSTFENPTTICIEGTPTDSSAHMERITVTGNDFANCSQFVDIKGASATANDLWRLVTVCDNNGDTCSGDGITVGDTTAIVKWGTVSDNTLVAVTGDGIVALLQNGRIADNEVPGAGGDGLDMTDCQDCTVKDNNFANAGANGIDATNSDDNFIVGNIVSGFATEAVVKDGTTGNLYSDNHGDSYSRIGSAGFFYENPASDDSTSANGQFATTVTIPAGTVQIGDVLRLTATTSASGANDRTFAFRIGGVDVSALIQNSGTVSGVLQCIVVVTALTGAATYASSSGVYSTGAGDPAADGGLAGDTTITVDWTTDTDIGMSFAQTATQTVVLDNLFVEMLGGAV